MKRTILIISAIFLGMILTSSSFAQDKTIVKRKVEPQGYELKDVMVSSVKKNRTSSSRKSKRKRTFSSQTQPHADGLVLERRRKAKNSQTQRRPNRRKN